MAGLDTAASAAIVAPSAVHTRSPPDVMKWLRANSLGTYLFTRWRGEFVGEDELGNRYYRERGSKPWREERRWVVFADAGAFEIDASMVPPGWHGWLNHVREKTPAEDPLEVKRWEKGHQPNLSGLPAAYVPPGHERRGGQRAPATGDYEAWRP